MNTSRNPRESVYADVNRCRPLQSHEPDANYSRVKHELIQRNWFEVRDKLKSRFPILSEADVEFEPGKKSEMMRNIEEKLEMSPSELQRIISAL